MSFGALPGTFDGVAASAPDADVQAPHAVCGFAEREPPRRLRFPRAAREVVEHAELVVVSGSHAPVGADHCSKAREIDLSSEISAVAGSGFIGGCWSR